VRAGLLEQRLDLAAHRALGRAAPRGDLRRAVAEHQHLQHVGLARGQAPLAGVGVERGPVAALAGLKRAEQQRRAVGVGAPRRQRELGRRHAAAQAQHARRADDRVGQRTQQRALLLRAVQREPAVLDAQHVVGGERVARRVVGPVHAAAGREQQHAEVERVDEAVQQVGGRDAVVAGGVEGGRVVHPEPPSRNVKYREEATDRR
jgi:hypothetical protein